MWFIKSYGNGIHKSSWCHRMSTNMKMHNWFIHLFIGGKGCSNKWWTVAGCCGGCRCCRWQHAIVVTGHTGLWLRVDWSSSQKGCTQVRKAGQWSEELPHEFDQREHSSRPRWFGRSLFELRWFVQCTEMLFPRPWLLYQRQACRQHVPKCHQSVHLFAKLVTRTELCIEGREHTRLFGR